MADPAVMVPNTLPAVRTRLIGRETERAEARSLLLDEATPLLTLTGPGGSGKTRLALAVAGEVADQFSDGVVWIDLSSLVDPTLVPATVARALDIVLVAGLPIEEQVVQTLRPRQTLLLLDNCEHLLDVTADLAADWLGSCPAVQILATSRTPLDLRGEQELPVDPFPLPAVDATTDVLAANAAVRLFVERAHAVDPRFVLNDTNAKAIAAICHRLDGLPLAIELAAARTKLLSPGALLAQMSDRLRLLRGGQRDLPERQRTMRHTIAWSYDLLAAEQQALFRRLAVFAGGCTLDAAAAVASDPASPDLDALDEIEVLVDQSLVRRLDGIGEPRFTMLETIREFGLEQLAAAGEEEVIRDRHATWFRQLVETLDLHHTMHRDAVVMRRLIPEQDNVRQALAWFAARGDAPSLNLMSAGMSIFWSALGQFAEARSWLQRAIADDTGVPLLICARAWHEAGWLAMCQGELDVSQPLHEAALRLARVAGEPYFLAEVILSGGTLAFWQGDLERAAALMEEGHQGFQLVGAEFAAAPVKAGAAVNFLGNIAFVAGDLPTAIERGQEAVAIARSLDATADLGFALCGLGYARLLDGATADAAACFVEATALTWTTGDDAFLARLFWAMAAVATTAGHAEVAARLIGAADTLDARTGSAMWPADRVLADWCLARLEAVLEPTALASARRAGVTLSVEQAIAVVRLVAAMVLDDERVAAIWQEVGAAEPGVPGDEPGFVISGHMAPSDATSVGGNLTRREREVLGLLSLRLSPEEIAERLAISPRTVQSHITRVFGKLGVTNLRDAAAFAARHYQALGHANSASIPSSGSDAFARDAGAADGDSEMAGLTPRELSVLLQLFQGRSDREIATQLFISRRTASKHVEAILSKLGVRSRGAAVAEARRLGLAPAPSPDQAEW